ncbi:YitT family protein, partial [Coprobacillus cateniformis]|nr:YitT family protein [Coprobacillus cateniformis]
MKQKLLHIVYIVVGNILIAFALSTLLLENNIIAGGVSGIGIIFNHYFGLSISLSVGILNVCLFVLGFLFLGKVFAMTTLVSTFLFPFLLEFFESQPVFHHYLNDPLLASIIAGCLIGIGVGLVLKANASTGGVDILAILLHRKLGAPVHIVLNITDLTILLFQFSFNDTTHVIYGIVTVMMTTIMLNKTLTAGTSLMQLVVISDYYEDIKDMILHDHDAGVTLLASEKG